jgi:probable HAF family extracellular repeat protein
VFKTIILILASVASPFAADAKENYIQISIPVPPGHSAEPIAVNAAGQVLAAHCNASVPADCAAIVWTERRGALTILSFTSGTASSFQLNDWGQVATLRTTAPPAQTIALWSPWDGWHDIAKFPQGGVTIAGMNNSGAVLGQTAQGAFLATRAFGAQFIPALTGDLTLAGINDSGVVTGALTLPCPPNSCLFTLKHAFRWTPLGGLKDLETRPIHLLPESVGLTFNRRGDVAGILYTPSSQQPFIWTDRDGLRDLGPPPGRLGGFAVVNDRRDLIGWWTQATCCIRSFIWREHIGFTDIGSLGGPGTYASDLNHNGQVVGYAVVPGSINAFLWSDGAITDLGPGRAIQINDSGMILGKCGATGACVWRRN